MRILIISLLLLGVCAAQEPSLGDLARQERARREAEEIANFKPGVPPPLAQPGESVPVHFLTVDGEAGQGEFTIKINNVVVLHDSYVRDLPIYISTILLDGGNLMEISMVSGAAPVDITIEERQAGASDRQVLARFHSEPSATPETVTKQIRFYAHPRITPTVELTDGDRIAITHLVTSFYDALKSKEEKQVLALFSPGIQDARTLYPEGAEFGQKQMNRMAALTGVEGFAMQPFDPKGLEMIAHGTVVTVKRSDGEPVFTSNELTLPGGGHTSVRADAIPVKKIAGQWRLTLPFGF